jgi:hypothetical protein
MQRQLTWQAAVPATICSMLPMPRTTALQALSVFMLSVSSRST